MMAEIAKNRPRLVVLGGGFGGFSLLSRLPRGLYDATLVSPRNYFLFTPLLPSAVTGTVEFRSILEPLRRRLGRVRVLEASAEGVDLEARTVRCRGAVGEEGFELEYDLLVIAVGAAVADYGVPGVAEHALPLATVPDARAIRRRVLEQFARADIPGLGPAEIRRRLRFVVCGGGPTGIEVAAEIGDLLDRELRRSHPHLAPEARVVVLEAMDRILTGFDEALGEYAARHFRREGVELRTSTSVVEVGEGSVRIENGEEMPCGLVVWAGGNAPVGLVQDLDAERNQQGRLLVDDHLRLVGRRDVYALGDCAAFGDPALPATAQVAQQQGKHLARALKRLARGREAGPFRYQRLGMLAYIGGGRALADLPKVKWSGRGAWLFWRSVYLTKLVSLANKIKVLFDWVKARLFGRDLSRF